MLPNRMWRSLGGRRGEEHCLTPARHWWWCRLSVGTGAPSLIVVENHPRRQNEGGSGRAVDHLTATHSLAAGHLPDWVASQSSPKAKPRCPSCHAFLHPPALSPSRHGDHCGRGQMPAVLLRTTDGFVATVRMKLRCSRHPSRRFRLLRACPWRFRPLFLPAQLEQPPRTRGPVGQHCCYRCVLRLGLGPGALRRLRVP